MTLTLFSASFLALPMEEFPTSKNSFWQQCPLSIPSTCFILFPTRVTWGWKLRVFNQHLSPNHDQLGTQLSWHAQSALPLLGEVHHCSNFLVNNCWLALFTECSLLALSYNNTINLSKRFIDSSMEEGLSAV